MSDELGRVIRAARLRQRLSQARLSQLAGISRRQLAAIEQGANTSTGAVRRIAEALQLDELPLGASTAHLPQAFTVAPRVLLDRASAAERSVHQAAAALHDMRSAIETYEIRSQPDSIRDRPMAEPEGGSAAVPLLAEITPGGEFLYAKTLELIAIDRLRIETGESLVRFRAGKAPLEGLSDGDLLIVEMRPLGSARTGELVIAIVDGQVWIGRWWNKRGRRLLRGAKTNRIVRQIAPQEAVVIFGAVTEIVHQKAQR